MTRRQLTDEQWKLIEPFLPIGEYGPYPARLRDQFEGVIWRFRTSSQWREMPGEFGVALKVGVLSYGGGFVITALMQADAVDHYHWMSDGQFLNAVALGQITPGPVVQTVAMVGYAAAGVGGGLLAAAVAFAPSFLFVVFGGPRFDRLRANTWVQAFLAGAGPAVIGAIAGSAIPLAMALQYAWQFGVLAAAALWLLAARRGVVPALLRAGILGVAAALAGCLMRQPVAAAGQPAAARSVWASVWARR